MRAERIARRELRRRKFRRICAAHARALVGLLDGVEGAREAEVGDLQQALLVEQQVRRLEVAVDQPAGVAVEQRLEALVHDELLVHRLEDVGADDGVEVGLHVVEDEVDVLVVLRLQHVLQPDDVLVPRQPLQVHDLAEGALRVGGVLEGVEDLLEGDRLLVLLVDRLEDDGVRPLPQLLRHVVLTEDVLRAQISGVSTAAGDLCDCGGER